MSAETLGDWLSRASGTLDHAPDAPRGLYERLRFVAEMLTEAGPLPAGPALVRRAADGTVGIHSIGPGLIVGREAPSDVVVGDPKLSRRHFAVRTEQDGSAVLRDLGSRNGTYVNGAQTVTRNLRDGDIIEAGDQVFAFVRQEEATFATIGGGFPRDMRRRRP